MEKMPKICWPFTQSIDNRNKLNVCNISYLYGFLRFYVELRYYKNGLASLKCFSQKRVRSYIGLALSMLLLNEETHKQA